MRTEDREVFLCGIDMATQSKNIGLATALFREDAITDIAFHNAGDDVLQQVEQLAGQQELPVLLAIDAPLGWPMSMGRQLAKHHAGELLEGERPAFFNRHTDLLIRERTGQRPLAVGMERIASTAFAALKLTGSFCAEGIPSLYRQERQLPSRSALEVYPAASLRVRGWPRTGYKPGEHAGKRRQEIVGKLAECMVLPREPASDHELDALLCLLTARDYLLGLCYEPLTEREETHAFKEGWIWVADTERIRSASTPSA